MAWQVGTSRGRAVMGQLLIRTSAAATAAAVVRRGRTKSKAAVVAELAAIQAMAAEHTPRASQELAAVAGLVVEGRIHKLAVLVVALASSARAQVALLG